MKPGWVIFIIISLLMVSVPHYALYEWDILDREPRRAIWVWGAGGTVKNWDGQPRWQRLTDNYKNSADLLIDFCRNKSIKDIYLYIGAWEWEQAMFTSHQLYNETGLEYIVTNAKKNCMKVYGLFYLWDDSNKLSDYQNAIENIVDSVVKYNERHPKGMLIGIQSDQEPYLSGSFDELLNMFQAGKNRIKYWQDQSSLGAEYFLFSHAISPAFIFTSFSWKGNNKKMYEHIMDILDHGVLMDYYDDSANIISRASPLVDYASKICKPVAIGIETGWRHVSDPNTFNDEIQSEATGVR